MRRTVEFVAVLTLASTLTLLGCSDPSLVTGPDELPTAPFFTRPPAEGFGVLRRNAFLASDLSSTRTLGVEGGRIEIEEAGVVLMVPPGALSQTTTITMTALAGDAVAFEFAPHGLRFLTPAAIHIDARGTEAQNLLLRGEAGMGESVSLDRFLGVYFEGDPDIGVDPLENINTYLLDEAIVFQIEHFSGYASASG